METLKTIVTTGSLVITICSLSFNIYQYRQNPLTAKSIVRIGEIKAAVSLIIQTIDSSEIFSVLPSHEDWPKGFKSLEAARSVLATANTTIFSSDIPPSDIVLISNDVLGMVRAVIRYRDSLNRTTGGKEFLERKDYENWMQKETAELALDDLQKYIRSRDQRLREYLTSLNL